MIQCIKFSKISRKLVETDFSLLRTENLNLFCKKAFERSRSHEMFIYLAGNPSFYDDLGTHLPKLTSKLCVMPFKTLCNAFSTSTPPFIKQISRTSLFRSKLRIDTSRHRCFMRLNPFSSYTRISFPLKLAMITVHW